MTDNCFIEGFDDGGYYNGEHSMEACAQLCLHDSCCASFDAGFGGNVLNCRLSSETRSTVPQDSFVCGAQHQMHYFEKKTTLEFNFNKNYDGTIKTNRDKVSFQDFIVDQFETLNGPQRNFFLTEPTVTISKHENGAIQATVAFKELSEMQWAAHVISSSGLALWW